jgi:hypothetical protein
MRLSARVKWRDWPEVGCIRSKISAKLRDCSTQSTRSYRRQAMPLGITRLERVIALFDMRKTRFRFQVSWTETSEIDTIAQTST